MLLDEDNQTDRVWWGCDYAVQGFPAAEPSLATRLKGNVEASWEKKQFDLKSAQMGSRPRG